MTGSLRSMTTSLEAKLKLEGHSLKPEGLPNKDYTLL